MTQDHDDTRSDPQAPVSPDRLRGEIGASATLAGGTGAGGTTPGGTATGVPGETLAGAGLTDHDQPAEGRRDEPADGRAG